MGPSGCGKSTLLDTLAGRTKLNVSGDVYLDGVKVSRTILRSRVGYVPQSRVYLSSLTVDEAITYRTLLKVPRNVSNKERMERVIC
jgi:ABC-type multidrug transport system ATPase subunit